MLDRVRERRDELHEIARRHKVEKLWVFGSCARKEEREDSDIDFLVEFRPRASLLDQVHLRDDVSDLFGRPVDVVSKRGLSPYIGPSILQEAVAV